MRCLCCTKGGLWMAEELPLYMGHNLERIPRFPLPAGYRYRYFDTQMDAKSWANVVTKTKEFPHVDKAMERFKEEFLPCLTEAKERIIFMETDCGEVVGTATAWFGLWDGIEVGRLHWVEIIPEYQGKQLGRPLITKAMQTLKAYHETAYLKTQKSSQAAIHLYRQLGWYPLVIDEQEKQVWESLFKN